LSVCYHKTLPLGQLVVVDDGHERISVMENTSAV